jgi:hypothetical protein
MTSEYKYLTADEYALYDLGVSGITNAALAEKHISYAEKLIDAYCGAWPRFYVETTGIPTSVSGTTIASSVFGTYFPDYWAAGGLYLHIYDGPAAGEERLIVSSASDGEIVLASGIAGMTTASAFILRQYSVFPRYKDVDFAETPFVPRQVKMAVACQVAYGVQVGSEGAGMWYSDPVSNARADLTSESYGSGYSYSRDARRVQGPSQFIAPQAALHLRGFVWRIGKIETTGGYN